MLVWVLPVFALLACFLVYPLASGFLLSLRRTNGSTPGEFVGLDNYIEALFRDDVFHQAVGNTVAFTAVAIVLQTGVGLLLAVLISELRRGRLPYRMVFFAPVVLSAVAVGSVWKWMYAPYLRAVHQHCCHTRSGRGPAPRCWAVRRPRCGPSWARLSGAGRVSTR